MNLWHSVHYALWVALIRVADWEQRHRRRESKPEDLDLIRELQALTRQQKQKMKDLIVSPHGLVTHTIIQHASWYNRQRSASTNWS